MQTQQTHVSFFGEIKGALDTLSHSELDMFIVFVKEVEVERRPMLARRGRPSSKSHFEGYKSLLPLQAIGCL